MDPYIGQIMLFAGNFAPQGWAFCDGRLLPINQYQAVFALLGTMYGGDGVNNFALPDLRGRVAVGSGPGPGLTPRTQGQTGGYEQVGLSAAQMPAHNHAVKCDTTSSGRDVLPSPQNNLPATVSAGGYGTKANNNPHMKSDMTENAGQGSNHENMPPWTCLNYIIALQGIFPPRS